MHRSKAQSSEETRPLRIGGYRRSGVREEGGGERGGGGTRGGDVDSHRVPLRGPWQFRGTVTATDAWHRTATPSQRYVFYQRPWSAITSATACWMSRTRNDGSLPSSSSTWSLFCNNGLYARGTDAILTRHETRKGERRTGGWSTSAWTKLFPSPYRNRAGQPRFKLISR